MTQLRNFTLILAVAFMPLSVIAGGVSGGGGGTTNPDPASLQQVHVAMRESKILLLAWLNSQELTYIRNSRDGHSGTDMQTLLFSASPNIFDVINRISIDDHETDFCHYRNSGPVDGSADSSQPNEICISSLSLSQKLTNYNYEFETAALILHEASHLLGADETLAVQIQKIVLQDLLHQSVSDYLSTLNLRILFSAQGVIDDLKTFDDHVDDFFCGVGEHLNSDYRSFTAQIRDEHERFLPLRAEHYDQALGNNTRYRMFMNAICLRDPEHAPVPSFFFESQINTCFGNAISVDAATCSYNLGSHGEPVGRDVIIQRIIDHGTLHSEWAMMNAAIQESFDEIKNLSDARFTFIHQ